jgi:opacity protein-like surface antigen
MKVTIVAACMLALVGSVFGQSEFQPTTPGCYISGLGGWIGIGSLHTTSPDLRERTEFDPGYNLTAALGYDFGLIRAEVEGSYLRSTIDKQVVNGVKTHLDGYLTAETILANGYFDFRGRDLPLVPYITGGLGWGNFEKRSSGISKHDNAPMGQFGGGAAWIFNSHWSIDVRIRYLASLEDLNFGSTDMQFYSTEIMGGVQYKF